VELPGLPPLAWTHGEGDAALGPDGELTLTAAPGVDWTNDPTGTEFERQHGSTSLSFDVTEDFQLSARVRVDAPRTTFDAGALTIWSDPDHWAKVCFERSPQGGDMIVSVVTNTYSDDSNATDVDTGSAWLRVSRLDRAFVFHSSTDGVAWRFVRIFRLLTGQPVVCGFMAQAPMGESAVARFDQIRYIAGSLAEYR